MNTLFPYPTVRGDIDLQVVGAYLDDGDFPKSPFIRDLRVIQVHDIDKENWERVRFSVELVGPAEEVLLLDRSGADAGAVLTAHCAKTNCRQSSPLQRQSDKSSKWTGSLELERSNFRGRVELVAAITGIANGAPNRILGSSQPWLVFFDEAETLPIRGTFRVLWVDFKETDDYPILKDYNELPFFTDLTGSAPTLFLNKSHDFAGLEAVLGDRKRTDIWEKALHNSERISIARSVWMAMVNASLAAIERGEEGERPNWPLTEWKRQVLQSVLPRIYPDMSDHEALATAWEAWQTNEGASTLESRCEAEIGAIIGAGRLLRRALSDLANTPTRS